MTCQVVLEFKVKPDCIEKLRIYGTEILPGTRGYDGCVSLVVVQNQDDPTSFMLVEQWDSRAKYEKYLAWRTETGVVDELVALMEGPPSFRFFNYFGI
ncbi:MAG: putative quinol monooxygenase [Gammaproteobacteria bacterium]